MCTYYDSLQCAICMSNTAIEKSLLETSDYFASIFLEKCFIKLQTRIAEGISRWKYSAYPKLDAKQPGI